MKFCNQCGSLIPNEQSICSMCMEDVRFEDDYYYEQWLEEQKRKTYKIRMEEEYYEELAEYERCIGEENFEEFDF